MNYKYLQYYEMNQFHYLFIIINSKIIIIMTNTQYVHNLILCNNIIFNFSYYLYTIYIYIYIRFKIIL